MAAERTEDIEDTREEVLLGRAELIELPLDSYIRMPQVRDGLNPELPALIDSIRADGLRYPIDVARLTEAEVTEYARFCDMTWDCLISRDEILSRRQPDGFFYLVVSGHSRCAAIDVLQAENPDKRYIVTAHVRDVHTPVEIVASQLAENIHTQPAMERQAIAIVELYRFGLEEGRWATKTEFTALYGDKISKRTLNAALAFHDLPEQARDFVFAKKIPYVAGVALGKGAKAIWDFVVDELGIDPADADFLEGPAAEAYRWRIGIMIAEMTRRRMNGPAARRFVEGRLAGMAEVLAAKQQAAKTGVQPTLPDLVLGSPEQQTEINRKQILREYRAALQEVERSSVESVQTAIGLHARLLGPDATQELVAEREHRIQALGFKALSGGDRQVAYDEPSLFPAS